MCKFYTLLGAIAITFCSLQANAQQRLAKTWSDEAEPVTTLVRVIQPTKARNVQINLTALREQLAQVVVAAYATSTKGVMPIVEMPMPDGTSETFRIWETSCMDPILAAKYPMIKTYSGQCIAHPEASLTIDASPYGFHAIAHFTDKTVYIDPYAHLDTEHYIVYNKTDFKTKKQRVCHTDDFVDNNAPTGVLHNTPSVLPHNGEIDLKTATAFTPTAVTVRNYRLALSGTAEYSLFHSPNQSKAQVLAAMVASINRVNGVYERELSVHLNLIAKNDTLIFFNATTDGFTNNSGSAMLGENQTKITALIGATNYDMGHVFSTNGGGVAQLGCICGSGKARGVTGTNSPVGDPFDIDYVVHEMGHQFGCEHTFNGSQGSCSGNRSSGSAYEPGSGLTIMAYAAICGSDDIAPSSLDLFHVRSFDQARTFYTGGGNSCAAATLCVNTPPTVSATTTTFVIPKNTPFSLTATGADADGDAITYCWEEFDLGATCAPNAATGTSPTFKTYYPTTSPTRYFPQMVNQLAGTIDIGNVLPNYARSLSFRCTVRDNHPTCGSVVYATQNVTVAATGPMAVTVPNVTGIIWPVGASQNITWSVASTDAAPVNCANVRITLSTDGGLTYPNEIVASTPNTGTYTWAAVGNFISTTCRVKVEAVGNIFFDVNDANFTIRVVAPDYTVASTDTLKSVCAPGTVDFNMTSQSISGFNTPISYTMTGIPVGSTPTWTGNPATPGVGVATLSLAIGASVASGTYNINIRGNAGGIIRNKIVKLVVSSVAPAIVTALNTPTANATIVLPTNTGFVWAAATAASSYIIEVASDAAFANIVATQTSTTASANLTTPLMMGTDYFWRVKAVNLCGTTTSVGQAFKTGYIGCVYKTTTTSVTIGTTANVTATSTLSMPDTYLIQDLNITGVNITHSYINDLSFRVLGPTGISATLMPRICAGETNFTNLTFDDASTVLYNAAGCPPAPGSILKPQQSLSVFNGTSPTGTWSLVATDSGAGDGGAITKWTVQVCVISGTPVSTDNIILNSPKVVIYPNPTNSILNVQLDETLQKSTLNIFNMQGQLVHSQNGAVNTTIDTNDWAGGMYILQVKTADALLTQKFVKN